MISVRLSEEEYTALRELCSASGARSVSDLTRDAMHAFLSGASRESGLHGRLDEFFAQMTTIGRQVEVLVEKFEASKRET